MVKYCVKYVCKQISSIKYSNYIIIIMIILIMIIIMTTRSSQLREQGNKAYTSKKNSQALKLYTESVRCDKLTRDKDDDVFIDKKWLTFIAHCIVWCKYFQICPLFWRWSGRRIVHGLCQQVLITLLILLKFFLEPNPSTRSVFGTESKPQNHNSI